MADSLCGPSNALQNFQKHSTVDRTLQQDRLITRQSPSQGFRSSPGLNSGLLESDFQAFQSGNLPPESQQGFQHPFSHAPPPQPGPAAWASDFQRMQISSPPPQFSQQTYNGQPQQRHDTGGWHQDFARQFGAEQRVMAQTSQITGSPVYNYSSLNGNLGMGMQPQFLGGMGQQVDQYVAHQQPAETFNEEAFARAFEEAAKEEQAKNGLEDLDHDMGMTENMEASKSTMELGQDILLEESAKPLTSASTEPQIPDQARLGADLIHDPMSESQHPEYEDPDALSRTAGQLLDSVRNNQSDKFQKSEFLGLMQLLRDKKVVVQGENIVETKYGGEEHKNKLLNLFWSLRRNVFGGNMGSSGQVRAVLQILLQLNETFDASLLGSKRKSSSIWDLESTLIPDDGTGTKSASYRRSRRLLQAVMDSPDFVTLPALRNLAGFTLLNLENIEKVTSNTIPSLLTSEMDIIRNANAEITSILPPTATALETLVYNYVSDTLQDATGISNQEPLNRLLGYEFAARSGERLYPTSTQSPHIQRAREILGPAISETMDACCGFWCPLLTVDDFFALVDAHQRFGGVRSEGFGKALREVEGFIKEELRATIKRTAKSNTNGSGIDAPGVAEADEQKFSYEEQLSGLEAQRRLRYKEAHNEHKNPELP